MSDIKILAKQTVVYGLPSIIGKILNYLLVPLHTYLFLPKDYGVVSELYAWIALLIVILTFGMETAFFRFSVLEKDKNKVFSTTVLPVVFVVVVFIALTTFFSQNIAVLMRYPEHPEYIIWLAFIVGIDVLSSLFFARLRALNKAFTFAGIRITNILINVALNLILLIVFPQLVAGVNAIFVANLTATVVTFLLLLIQKRHFEFSFDRQLFKKMLVYALPLLIFGLAGVINETFDRVMLKYLSPQEIAQSQVGIYSACYKISVMMTILIQAFKYAAEPFYFNKSVQSDAKETYSRVMNYFVLICSFVFLLIILNIDIVKFFVGTNYHEGLGVVSILLIANLMLGVFYNLSVWYKNTGKTQYGAFISLVGVAITLGFNYALIPHIGYYAAAWTTLICNVVMVILSYIYGQKYYYIRYNLKRLAFYFFTALIFYGISLAIPVEHSWVKLTCNNVLILIYLAVVLYPQRTSIKLLIRQAPLKRIYGNFKNKNR